MEKIDSRTRKLQAKSKTWGGTLPVLLGLRWIDSAHDLCLKSGPVYSALTKYLVFNEKWSALRVFKHKNCIKFSFRSTLTEFQGSLMGIALEAIILPSSRKSVVLKTLRNITFYLSMFYGSNVWCFPLQSTRNPYRILFVINVLKISNSKHQLVLSPRKLTAYQKTAV